MAAKLLAPLLMAAAGKIDGSMRDVVAWVDSGEQAAVSELLLDLGEPDAHAAFSPPAGVRSARCLAEVLKRRAAEHPDRDYLKFADSPWVSYGEINGRSNRIANALIGRGVQPGEAISVMLPNCEDFIPIWFGILKAGAVMSSINTAYKGDFLSWTINLVEARKLIVSTSSSTAWT